MSEPNQTDRTQDDLLADFADRVLDGRTSSPVSSADVELRGLEELVLRLQQSIPQEILDEKMLRRMQADFKVRARRASAPRSSVWDMLRPRQRLTLALVGLALAAILVVFPFLPIADEPIYGTAGIQSRDILLFIGVVCMLILLIWIRRRR